MNEEIIRNNYSKIQEIEDSLTCKFNALDQIWKKTGFQSDFHKCAVLQSRIYHLGGHIIQHGKFYRVQFIM